MQQRYQELANDASDQMNTGEDGASAAPGYDFPDDIGNQDLQSTKDAMQVDAGPEELEDFVHALREIMHNL